MGESLVYRTIKRYVESGSTKKRAPRNRSSPVATSAIIKTVRERLRRNPRRSASKLAKELDLSRTTVMRILKDKLNVRPYKIQKKHELTATQMKVRMERAKEIIRRHGNGDLPNIVFSDEKNFTIQQFVNKQNDRVWLQNKSGDNSKHLVATRKQAPAQVMVWAAVTSDGRSPLVFLDKGVKINGQVYRQKVLEDAFKPWASKHFGQKDFTFQQDSAPAHKARETQEWLTNNVPRHISADLWPPYSPDANPMDFCIWSILEAKVCSKKHESVGSLKAHLLREWELIPQNTIRAACDAFLKRLKAIVRAKGGHIE